MASQMKGNKGKEGRDKLTNKKPLVESMSNYREYESIAYLGCSSNIRFSFVTTIIKTNPL